MRPYVAPLALIPYLALAVAAAPPEKVKCSQVEVSSGSSSSSAAAKFQATKILDLDFTVLVPVTVSGDHVVELRVFTPDGQLYRSTAVPVTDGTRPTKGRAVAGYPRPLPEKALTRVTRGGFEYAAVSVPFPVAGTDIVSTGLYGRWKVQAHMNGADEPCAAAAAFTLNP